MRKFFAALACAGALCAVAAAPFGWIALTAPAPFVRSVESALPRLDVASVDLRFAPTPARGFLEAEYPDTVARHEILPLPRNRPPTTALLLAEARAALGKGPRELGTRPDLWCADWINKTLRRLGLAGTGSALASSFKPWGVRSATPCVGCVGVMPRRGGSGHVVIIDKVRGRTVYAYSPNGGRNRMRYATYPLSRFTAFRAPAA